jgi:hypothetical protein
MLAEICMAPKQLAMATGVDDRDEEAMMARQERFA